MGVFWFTDFCFGIDRACAQLDEVPSPLSLHTAELFQTEFGQDVEQLGLFNLFHFYSESESWAEAELEIKLSLPDEDLAQLKLIKQLQSNPQSEVDRQMVRHLSLPPLDYAAAGQLKPVGQLVNPLWIIWAPASASSLSADHKKAIRSVINTIKEYSAAESELYLFSQSSFPLKEAYVSRLADLDLSQFNLLKAEGAIKKSPPKLTPTLHGFVELLSTLRVQRDVGLEANYDCGKPCAELLPHVRLVILCEDDSCLTQSEGAAELLSELSPIKHPNHDLYRAQLFIYSLSPLQDPQRSSPEWWRWFQHIDGLNAPQIGGDQALMQMLEKLKYFERHHYYVTPPTSLHPHIWGNDRTEISLRISKGEATVVQRGELLRPPVSEAQLVRRLSESASRHQSRLFEIQRRLGKPAKLSLTTRVLITLLWVSISCLVIAFIVLKLRRGQSQGSGSHPVSPNRMRDDPLSGDLLSDPYAPTEQNMSVPPSGLPSLDPSERARVKRREREEMMRANRPSKSSPMIDPDQPSTVPAPAAEARISDQPSQMKNEQSLQPSSSKSAEMLDDFFHEPHKMIEETPSPKDEVFISEYDEPSVEVELPSWQISEAGEAKNGISEEQLHSDEDESEAVTLNTRPLAGLYAERGPMRRFFFVISHSPCVVGRNPLNGCPLPPDGVRSDRQISREHFELLSISSDKWEIRCLSAQGLQLENHVLNAGDTALLKDKSLILIGETELRFRCSAHWRSTLIREHLNLQINRDHSPRGAIS